MIDALVGSNSITVRINKIIWRFLILECTCYMFLIGQKHTYISSRYLIVLVSRLSLWIVFLFWDPLSMLPRRAFLMIEIRCSNDSRLVVFFLLMPNSMSYSNLCSNRQIYTISENSISVVSHSLLCFLFAVPGGKGSSSIKGKSCCKWKGWSNSCCLYRSHLGISDCRSAGIGWKC